MPYGFPRLTVAESPVVHTTDTGLPLPVTSTQSSSLSTLQTILSAVMLIFFDFIPGQLYLHFLLRIPSLYFSRVTRIFEDARLSLPDIKRMARAKSDQWDVSESRMWPVMAYPDTMPLPRSLLHFRASWESFIDSLLREWKTFNLISVLLLSAILTLLQIDAASHPITRTSALFSLICALMSLLYGCMFIIRFGTMRKMHKASSFANEAQKQSANIWWNIWVLLAMPAVWLAWSIITFLISIMSFVWLSGSTQDAVDFSVSFRAALGPRIALTVVFALGIIYFVLIVRTFHRYGDPLDREWMRTVNEWTTEAIRGQASFVPSPSSSSYVRLSEKPDQFNASRSVSAQSRGAYATPLAALARAESRPPDNFEKLAPSVPLTSHPSAFFRAPESACALPISSSTVMQLGPSEVEARSAAYADPQWSRAVTPDDWSRFILDVSSAWNGQLTLAQTEDDLPVYTIVPPTRPDNPVPASPGSGGGSFGSDPPRLSARSIPSSDSSYGRVRPSKHNKNGFVALHSPVLEDENAPLPKSRSRPATPPPPGTEDPRAGPVNPAQTVEQFIGLWNEHYFRPRNLQVSLVQEHGPRTSGPAFAVTLGPLESPTNAVTTDETGFGLGSFMTMQDISRILRR
ncbi:hypothetical protein R3P38DRAFT_2522605 [Favolaschia claudopus]|uniref:Uncharacterized protein n=1 Tax=Favolaschia claudopus TaxID=2862362 RepID=A0AAW0BZB5_9AGAR